MAWARGGYTIANQVRNQQVTQEIKLVGATYEVPMDALKGSVSFNGSLSYSQTYWTSTFNDTTRDSDPVWPFPAFGQVVEGACDDTLEPRCRLSFR